jgi:hypothetical protein
MPPEAWAVVRELVFQRDRFICRSCGRRPVRPHCDHIVPLAGGGTNSPYNLQTLCGKCNIRKNAHLPTFQITRDKWGLWHQLISYEPRLVELFLRAVAEVPAVRSDENARYCANNAWYMTLKPDLCELVGYSRRPDLLLGTSKAYDVAYEVIYNILPPCKGCWCL